VNTIIIHTNKGLQLCSTNNIIRIQGMSNYCRIYFADNSYPLTVAKVLCWFKEQAALISFVRIHRTHFINTHYIKSYSAKSGLVTLYNGETFSVARRKKAGLSQRLNSLNNSCADGSVYTTQFPIKRILAA